MAPSAVDGERGATPGLDEVSKPPAGVVLPPKDIRAIVEKTAGYVARNGPVFEDRIREKERHNPKFSFLSANDAYSPYYDWRLSEVREGRGTAISAGRAGEAAPAEPEKPKGPPEPSPFHFSARMPNINAQDLDVVKLTALFVAKNGRSFMTTLSQRETRNFQFDFLRPQHSLYQFFSRLVDQYTELLRAGGIEDGGSEKARIAELESNFKNRFHVLDRAKQRAEWAKYQEEQKQKKEEEAEQEKLAYSQIDWHDFVVVETVLFTDADDQADLPAPTSLSDLQSASLEQKAMMSLQPHNMRIEEAMPTEEDNYYNSSYTPQSAPTQTPTPTFPPQSQYTPSYSPGPPSQATPSGFAAHATETEEEQRIRERTEARERAQQAAATAKGAPGPMRIRNDYVPRAQARRQNVAMALCPNCKQQIPFDELDQHMRIELLDPRWKEQRAKSDLRHSTTNLSTQDVANNLKRLASQRSDVFDGVTGAPLSEEEANRRKRAAANAGTYYETGQTAESKDAAQAKMQSMNIEEQLRRIHEKFGQETPR
ncbi:MAG: hypothetical protein M1819_003706 [Sarea resinae]|nr:MAG: hypothetical protein M1819_003706 [Sarea resinae]